jgi:hypothetical protein
VIKQEPEFNQMNVIKPVYAELPESSGPPSSQLIEQPHQQQLLPSQRQPQLPQQQTTSTAYDEFQRKQQLLLHQYQEQLQAQLLLHKQQFEQQQLPTRKQQQTILKPGSGAIFQPVVPSKSHEAVKVKTEPGLESTTSKSGLSQTLTPNSGLEPASTSSSNDLSLIESIDKSTVLRGLVREYIDSQRGILEVYQVGHSGLLTEPVAGNFKISDMSVKSD